jgi:hypothetical protein
MRSVRLDGTDSDSQKHCDLFVRLPLSQKANDFNLTGRCSRTFSLQLFVLTFCLVNISSQKTDLKEGRQQWDFSAETHFSDYGLAGIQSLNIPQYSQEKFQNVIPARPHLGKEFWIPWALDAASIVTSIELTEACLHAHECREGNPVWGPHPSRLSGYSVRFAALSLPFYFARKEKLKGNKFRWQYLTYIPLAANGYDAIHDIVGYATH